MALNDILPFSSGSVMPGTKKFKVVAGGTARIKAGELVFKSLGNTAGYVVTQWTSAITTASAIKPQVGTDYIAGLAMTSSTESSSAVGYVQVMPNLPGMTYLVAPAVAATWNTQAKYDALVGSRVMLNYAATTGKITALAADYFYGGAVVEPLDIQIYPGKVRFSLRQGLNYFA
jgi:hypothetical protein